MLTSFLFPQWSRHLSGCGIKMFQNGYWFMDIRFCNTIYCVIWMYCYLLKGTFHHYQCPHWYWGMRLHTLGWEPAVFSAALHGKLFRNMPTVANLLSRMFVALTFWAIYWHKKSTVRYFYTCLGINWFNSIVR